MIDSYEKMPGGYKDGWSSWNPNNASCEECGSSNIEFYWTNGRVWKFRCKACNYEDWDQK